MSIDAFQILSIEKTNKNISKYVLNTEKLSYLLDPKYKDKDVSIISIAGPSRMGKSFLLSYFIRFLSNPYDTNWIGESDDPLTGFEWKTDLDTQTSGIWLSKPYILEQSNGNEIVVLLMDTQGVFDDIHTQRDWSTIVGISLLSSSCFIFNIFNNLQEDMLLVLESFLEYGILASNANSGNEFQTPFQSLYFLIRDWNMPSECSYGQRGGQRFLDRKLDIKDNQSSSSQKVRRLIRKCFKEVLCFLLPEPGENAKASKFNGSVGQLSEKFVEKIIEFTSNLLDPNEIETKKINNSKLTAGDFCEYLKAFVSIFNSDKLPEPIDIIDATAKTSDLMQINKLKESCLIEMRHILDSKSFIERKKFKNWNNENLNETLTKFKNIMKTTNDSIEKELNEILHRDLTLIYKQFFIENEQRRDNFLNESVVKSGEKFSNNISERIDTLSFVEASILDEILKTEKKKAINIFEESYGEEDKNIISAHYLNLTKIIENSENFLRSENFRKISEAEKNNINAVNDSIDYYKNEMRSILVEYAFVEKEQFSIKEKKVRTDAIQLFNENCTLGYSTFIENYELRLYKKLDEVMSELKSLNQTNYDKAILMARNLSNELLADYENEMRKLLKQIQSKEELINMHEMTKNNVLQQLNENCVYNQVGFLIPFNEKLEKDMGQVLFKLESNLLEQIENVTKVYKNAVKDTKDFYIKNMELLFTKDEFFSEEELNILHEEESTKSKSYFKSITDSNPSNEIEVYLTQIEKTITEEFVKFKENNKLRKEFKEKDLEVIINDFITEYEDIMGEVIETAENESELILQHEIAKKNIFENFKLLNSFPDSNLFDPFIIKLENKINKSLKDSIQLFEAELKNQDSEVMSLLSEVRKFYSEEMNKYYQKTKFYMNERLQQLHDSVLNRVISKYESERGNMPSEKFKKLIINSLKEVFIEVKEKNAMNAPTLTAIGIDLGTTNSCVAYYKSDAYKGNVIVIPNELGKNTTASVVAITESQETVGDVAKEEAYGNPRNTLFMAKRLIGRKFSDDSVQKCLKLWPFLVVDDGENNPKFSLKIDSTLKTYHPEQISAKVLKKMKETAEMHLGCKVTKAVITVPAYFNDSQKEATKDAGVLAGLEVLKIINEPTAAALAFKFYRNDDLESRKVLIFDFGGGTFDVAVLVMDRANIEIKSVGGDNHLGGDDLDSNIVQYCLDEFFNETGIRVDNNAEEGKAISRLRKACEEKKRNLSSVERTVISIDDFFDSNDLSVILTRDKFEELNYDLFIKSMNLVQQTLDDANVETFDIDDVVLVGGSTRIPRVQEMLSEMFDGKALNHEINPDEAVAVGAAIQAAILNGNEAEQLKQLKVTDVSPMSIGVKVKGGSMSVIIPRNSKVPNVYTRDYVTTFDSQTLVDVEIYEGEDKMVANNRLLGNFVLSGITSAPKGEQIINVTLNMNDEGILNVKAQSAAVEEEIEIKEHKGRLTDQELQDIIEQVFFIVFSYPFR